MLRLTLCFQTHQSVFTGDFTGDFAPFQPTDKHPQMGMEPPSIVQTIAYCHWTVLVISIFMSNRFGTGIAMMLKYQTMWCCGNQQYGTIVLQL